MLKPHTSALLGAVRPLCATLALCCCGALLAADEPVAPTPAETVRGAVLSPETATPQASAAATTTARAYAATGTEAEEKGVHVSLEEAIECTIQNNLGLKLSRINDRITDINVRTQWAKFYPVFNLSAGDQNEQAHSLATTALATRTPDTSANNGVATVTGSVAETTPWGTTLDFTTQETHASAGAVAAGLALGNASGTMGVAVTQPLWKGYGTDVGLLGVRTARIARLISRGNLELSVESLIFQARADYANIVQQIQNCDVNLQQVKSAKTFYDLTRAQEGAGLVTKLDVFNAEVQLHADELNLLTSEKALQDAYDALKVLMDVDLEEKLRVDAPILDFGDTPPEGFRKELRPDEASGTVSLVTRKAVDGMAVDKPIGEAVLLFRATRFHEPTVLAEALAHQIQLINQRRELATAKLNIIAAKNGLGQQVDLVGGVNRSATDRSLFTRDNSTEINQWNFGVNYTYQWGKIADRAAYEQALLGVEQAEIALKQARTSVQAKIRQDMRQLRVTEQSILIESRAVEAAKLTVEATTISFERGLKSSFDVIIAEDNLLTAKTTFVSYMENYVVALAQLEEDVGKPTGRIDLNGDTCGGVIDSRLPDSARGRPLPARAPNAVPAPEDDPTSDIRVYRKDYDPNKAAVIDIPASEPAEAKK